MIKIFLPMFFMFLTIQGEAQTKKQIKNANIKSQVIWINKRGLFKEIHYKSKEFRFDKNGNCIEEIAFNRRGRIIIHRAYEYEKDLLINEFRLDSKGKIVLRINFRYRNEILVEKKYFNTEGKQIGQEQMIFEYQD